MKITSFLIFIVLVFLGYWLFQNERFDVSTDVEDIQYNYVSISEAKFKVPVNYFHNREPIEKDFVVDQINLVMLLPSLKGYDESLDGEFNCSGWCNKLNLSIYSYRGGKSIAHRVKCYQIQTGAVVHEGVVCDGYDALMLNEDKSSYSYFFEYEGMYFMIKCSKDGVYSSPSCKVSSDYSGNISYDYSFSKDMFDAWFDVNKKIMSLISGFQLKN